MHFPDLRMGALYNFSGLLHCFAVRNDAVQLKYHTIIIRNISNYRSRHCESGKFT